MTFKFFELGLIAVQITFKFFEFGLIAKCMNFHKQRIQIVKNSSNNTFRSMINYYSNCISQVNSIVLKKDE